MKRIPLLLLSLLLWTFSQATGPSGPEGLTTGCDDELAYWDLDDCHPGSSYSEFTADVRTPSGFSSVSASIFSNDGDRSCTPGFRGVGVCSDSRDACSFSTNNNDAFMFEVRVRPRSGFTVTVSKLQLQYLSYGSNFPWE